MRTVEVELFDKQYDAFSFSTQFAAAVAGVQSGKTFMGSLWAGKKINEFPAGIGIIGAPTYKLLNQSTLVKFFSNFPQLRKHYKEQKGELVLPTGGTVFTRSFDQPFGVEGITADWIWLDEGGQMPLMAWTVARSRVAITRGQILITTTPYALNWLYSEFYLPWQNKQDLQFSVFTWRSIDNPHFPKEYFEAERRRLSEEEFARRYCGEFTKMEGLVYDLPTDQIIEPTDKLNVKEVILGLDFGFHNPAAAVVIKVTADNVFYITDEYYQPSKTQDELEDDLKALLLTVPFRQVYPDPAEPDRIAAMKKHGFYTKAVDKNVSLGIDKVRELIRKKQLFVFSRCRNFLDEINYYHYDPERPKEEPVKDKDHLMDALRYALYNYSTSPLLTLNVQQGGIPKHYPQLGI
jgi:PBSX family phage terminase large subunit